MKHSLETVRKALGRLHRCFPYLGQIQIREVKEKQETHYELVVPIVRPLRVGSKTKSAGTVDEMEPVALITRAQVKLLVGQTPCLRKHRERVETRDCWEVSIYAPIRGTREEPPDAEEVTLGMTERDDLLEAVLLYERAMHAEALNSIREEACYDEMARENDLEEKGQTPKSYAQLRWGD